MANVVKPVSINHVGLHASDPKRSLEWFQGIFGFPVVARQGDTPILRVGDGPQYFALHSKPDKQPGYTHFCFSIENFDPDEFTANLREIGLKESSFPGPMQYTVRNRVESGGDPEGTPEVFIGDPDGIIVQVQDTKYCGGAGPLGDVGYTTPEPAPTEGFIRTIECNHCTLVVTNGSKALEFYQAIFDLPVDTYQGSTPILRVGSGNASIVLFDRSTEPEAKEMNPHIDHVCFAVEDFDVDRIEKALSEYGLEVLGQARVSTGPLQTYYTARMPDRGGDPQGTKELYFTDPDGTVVQLQDVRYAGGCGSLGEIRGTGVKHPF